MAGKGRPWAGWPAGLPVPQFPPHAEGLKVSPPRMDYSNYGRETGPGKVCPGDPLVSKFGVGVGQWSVASVRGARAG